MNSALQPIPQRYICKLKYATNSATDISGRYIMNLNSLFDPDRTGGGHQPYAFDNLTALYNRYRVFGCSYRITCLNSTTNIQLGCIATNEAFTITNIAELKENPRSKFVVQQATGSPQVLKGHISIPSLMGRTKQAYLADDRYQALTTSDPLELALLNIYVADNTGGTLNNVYLQIELMYHAEFFDMKNVAQS